MIFQRLLGVMYIVSKMIHHYSVFGCEGKDNMHNFYKKKASRV